MHLYLVFKHDDLGERVYVAHMVAQSDQQFLRSMERMLDSDMRVFRYNLTDEVCNGTMTAVRYEEPRFELVDPNNVHRPTR